mmetsp:Transcript_68522/g.79819  ORF Transcript_68522/g.79819 Transcript_68522/m.79819 type:complete len:344 (+) Transcript_68522:358-1389(+)
MNTGFKVAVAGKHRRAHDLVLHECLADTGVQLSTIADARHASVSSNREPLLGQRLQQIALLQVLLHSLASRGQGRLDVGRNEQTTLCGLLGDKASSDEHVGVGGVGAGRNRCNDNIAVVDGVLLSFVRKGSRGLSVVFGDCKALEIALRVVKALREVSFLILHRHEVVGTLGAGNARLNGGEVQIEVGSELGRVGGLVVGKQTHCLQVLTDVFHLGSRSARLDQVLQRYLVNREETARRAVLGGHVGNGGTVGKREICNTRSIELNELSDNTSLSEHLGDGKDQISGSNILSEFSSKLETNDFRQDHGNSLSEHDRLGFNTSNTPTDNTETIDHGGVRVSSDN